MRFSARLDTSHHGPPQPFKDAREVGNSLTGIHNAMVRCLFVSTRAAFTRVLGDLTEYSNLANVEAVQWVLLYLSIGHYMCF
jgi:hypothetical protein